MADSQQEGPGASPMPSNRTVTNSLLSPIVFLRFDPPIKVLLSSIQKFVEINNNKGLPHPKSDDAPNGLGISPNTTTAGSESGNEKWFTLLRNQARLMEALKEDLATFSSQSAEHTVALAALSDYVLLPFLAILSSYSKIDPDNSVRRSALFNCLGLASESIISFLTLTNHPLATEKSVQLLMICSKAIPNIDPLKIEEDSMDRGEDCACSILRCIEVVISSEGESNNQLCQQASEELGGMFLTTVSFCCVSFISTEGDTKVEPTLQLQAVRTLRCLLTNIPVVEKWRAVFPGCFTGLIRLCFMRLRRSNLPQVTAATISCIAVLLQVTLKPERQVASARQYLEVNPLEKLMSLAARRTNLEDTPTRLQPGEPEHTFISMANVHLPTPLGTLLNLVQSAPPRVRVSAAGLCQTILIDAAAVWNDENKPRMERNVLFCCILMSQDENESVASQFSAVIDAFRLEVGEHDWKSKLSDEVVPLVMDLIKELPATASSLREADLSSKIKFITGCLTLSAIKESAMAVLATPDLLEQLRKSLTVLYDVDLSSDQSSQTITTIPHQHSMSLCLSVASYSFRFHLMSINTAKLADSMVRSLGSSMRAKHAFVFVDACLADLFESCVKRAEGGFNPLGVGQVSWLHEWIGTSIVADQMLKGISDNFRQNYPTSECNIRKRKRKYKSFLEAVIPIITSPPLWSLPTTLQTANSRTSLEKADRDRDAPEVVSAQALRGNAILTCSLIQLVGVAIMELDSADSTTILASVTYSLFQKANPNNHPQVRTTALATLDMVAKQCASGSVPHLALTNFQFMFGRLRSRAREVAANNGVADNEAFRNIVATLRGVLEQIMQNENQAFVKEERIQPVHVALTVQLLSELTTLFDRRFLRLSINTEVIFHLVGTYDTALQLMASSIGLRIGSTPPFPHDTVLHTEDRMNRPWLKLLDPFRLPAKDGLGDDDHASVAEGQSEAPRKGLIFTNEELDFLDLVAKRCGFFLSTSNLMVQRRSCDVLGAIFQLLGEAEKLPQVDDENGDGNRGPTVFRVVAELWSPIFARIRTHTSLLVDDQKYRGQNRPGYGGHETSLCSLFNLVALACGATGSFLASRVHQELWPMWVRLLVKESRGSQATSGHQNIMGALTPANGRHFVHKQQTKLIISILECLSSILRCKEFAMRALGLIHDAGTVIIVLMDDPGPIGDAAVMTLKTFLSVDSDALWRPIMSLSRPLPQRSTATTASTKITVFEPESSEPTGGLLQTRARELFNFMESLPEQPIE